MLKYQKRISFDSINPNEELSPNQPIHVPPQYLDPSHSKPEIDLNFGFESSFRSTDVTQIFNGFNHLGVPTASQPQPTSQYQFKRKRVPKLPPPPNKSILKHSGGYAQMVDLKNAPAMRKKSFVDMTTEELLALDQQYRKGVDLSELKFDGDGYLPFQAFNTFDSKKGKKLGNIDKAMNFKSDQKNDSRDLDFSSYAEVYKHQDFKKFVVENSIRNESSNYKDSLRDIMVYISGRRHTWDAINWSFKNYLKDGDQLIIVCRVPRDKDSDFDDNENDNDNDNDQDYDSYHSDIELEREDIKYRASNLKIYISKIIEVLNLSDLKLSIIFEFIIDYSLKRILKQIIDFYDPHVMILSSLMTMMDVHSRTSYKLPAYVMKKLNIPVITIPDLLIDEESVSLLKPKLSGLNDDSIPILDKLNQYSDSIDSNRDYEPIYPEDCERSYLTRSEPVVTPLKYYPDTINSDERPYFPDVNYKLVPTIKFSDDLKVPRTQSNYLNSKSPLTSRRGSSSNTPIYKVKSLLDDESLETTKSGSTNGLSLTQSNEITQRRSSGNIKKVISAPDEKPSKSFFGLFKRRSK